MIKLRLDNEPAPLPVGVKRATDEEIAERASRGYAHIVCDGASYFVNPSDEYERARLQKTLGVENYKWFQEATGAKHWVLFNPKHFKIDKDYENRKVLKINSMEYDGGLVETPINASSLCGLFSWSIIPENIKFSRRFSLKDITELSLMYAGSRIPENVDLSPCFKTNTVLNTRYMFYRTKLPKKFQIPDTFDTSFVSNMEYMFAQMTIPDKFEINLHTDSAMDVNHMFFNANFDGSCSFGENFKLYNDMDTDCMFDGCIIKGRRVMLTSNYSFRDIKMALR